MGWASDAGQPPLLLPFLLARRSMLLRFTLLKLSRRPASLTLSQFCKQAPLQRWWPMRHQQAIARHT
jgi:hypothetical protein